MMHEDQIITRAHQEVQARRAARRRNTPWGHGLEPVLVLLALGGFFAAPGTLPRKLLLAMGGVCGLRPAHSYFAGPLQLPLEARMIGIYGGLLLTLIVLVAQRRVGARWIGSRRMVVLLAALFGSMVFDGVNSTLAEVGWPHLYTPTNPVRLITGVLSGTALAFLLAWLLGVHIVPRERRVVAALAASPRALVLPLGINALFVLLVLAQQTWLYYPLALLGVGGIISALTGVALLVILTLMGLEGRITHWRQLMTPGALAVLVSFAILAGTAALRWIVLDGGVL